MRKREQPIYDNQILEHMKRYFKIESNDELLQYIKTKGLVVGHTEDRNYT
jgi:hypothetical protein